MNRKNSVLSMLALLGAMIFNVNFSYAVLVDPAHEDDSTSEAATLKCIAAGVGFETIDPPAPYTAGGATLIYNNESTGKAAVLTATHTFDTEDVGGTLRYQKLVYCFSPNSFTAFAEGNYIEADLDSIVRYDYQGKQRDLAIVWLKENPRDEDGELIQPMRIYEGTLAHGDKIHFLGYGVWGDPAVWGGSPSNPNYDGRSRCGVGKINAFISGPSIVCIYDTSPAFLAPGEFAGMLGRHDSGCLSAVKDPETGKLQLVGTNDRVSGSGVDTWSTLEYLDLAARQWVTTTLAAGSPSGTPTPTPSATPSPSPSPTPTATPSPTPSPTPAFNSVGDTWPLYTDAQGGGDSSPFVGDGQYTQEDVQVVTDIWLQKIKPHPTDPLKVLVKDGSDYIERSIRFPGDRNGDGKEDWSDLMIIVDANQDGVVDGSADIIATAGFASGRFSRPPAPLAFVRGHKGLR